MLGEHARLTTLSHLAVTPLLSLPPPPLPFGGPSSLCTLNRLTTPWPHLFRPEQTFVLAPPRDWLLLYMGGRNACRERERASEQASDAARSWDGDEE